MIRFRPPRVATIIVIATAVTSVACVTQDHSNSATSGRDDSEQCLEFGTDVNASARAADLVGEFDIVLHVTAGLERDSVIRGRITLARPIETNNTPAVVYGWTTVSEERVGEVVVTTPLSSTDPTQPGVLGILDPLDSSLVLLLGSAAEGGNMSLHTGLTLLVLLSEPGGFRGTWVVETNRLRRPAGFFCAWRTREDN